MHNTHAFAPVQVPSVPDPAPEEAELLARLPPFAQCWIWHLLVALCKLNNTVAERAAKLEAHAGLHFTEDEKAAMQTKFRKDL